MQLPDALLDGLQVYLRQRLERNEVEQEAQPQEALAATAHLTSGLEGKASPEPELLVERIEANYDEPPCAYAAQQSPRQLKQLQDVAEAALRSSKQPPKQKQKKTPRKSKKPPPVSS